MNTRLVSAIALVGLLVVGLSLAWSPFYAASRRMQRYCDELTPGLDALVVRSRAHQLEYVTSFDEDPSDGGTRTVTGSARVLDPRFTQFACDMRFDGGVLSSRVYNGD